MQQGHSGSLLKRSGGLVEKFTSDHVFSKDIDRQQDLINLSRRLAVLPRIMRIEGSLIVMEFIEGNEGLTRQNAFRAGRSLRLLHEQRTFTHPCLTGVGWLIELANANLIRSGAARRVSPDSAKHFPNDALIHADPVQLIESPRGEIIFIDIEGLGFGSRYQDLGFIEFTAAMQDDAEMLQSFMKGYELEPIELDERLRRRMAGLIALAYSGFADTEKRLAVGLRLLQQTRSFS
jgi:hypothetical protein